MSKVSETLNRDVTVTYCDRFTNAKCFLIFIWDGMMLNLLPEWWRRINLNALKVPLLSVGVSTK